MGTTDRLLLEMDEEASLQLAEAARRVATSPRVPDFACPSHTPARPPTGPPHDQHLGSEGQAKFGRKGPPQDGGWVGHPQDALASVERHTFSHQVGGGGHPATLLRTVPSTPPPLKAKMELESRMMSGATRERFALPVLPEKSSPAPTTSPTRTPRLPGEDVWEMRVTVGKVRGIDWAEHRHVLCRKSHGEVHCCVSLLHADSNLSSRSYRSVQHVQVPDPSQESAATIVNGSLHVTAMARTPEVSHPLTHSLALFISFAHTLTHAHALALALARTPEVPRNRARWRASYGEHGASVLSRSRRTRNGKRRSTAPSPSTMSSSGPPRGIPIPSRTSPLRDWRGGRGGGCGWWASRC